MKKGLLLVAICLSTFFNSCSNDDDSAPSLQGKWEYFKEGTANSTGQEFLTDYEHQSGCTKDYSNITASTIIDHSFFGSTCEEEIFSTPYTRNGNTISITSEGETFTAEIKTLDANTLKIYSTDPDFPGIIDVTVFKRIN
jgi:hypothetical protein